VSCSPRLVTASNRIFFSSGGCGGGDCRVSSIAFAFFGTAALLRFSMFSGLTAPTFGVISKEDASS